MIGTRTCEHPSCTDDANKTYSGSQGNTLRLCGQHYYNAVTDGDDDESKVTTPSIGLDITQPHPGERFDFDTEPQPPITEDDDPLLGGHRFGQARE